MLFSGHGRRTGTGHVTSVQASVERHLEANAQRARSVVSLLRSPPHHLDAQACLSVRTPSMPYVENRLFVGARRDVIEKLGSVLTPRTYARKAVVFDEGDPASLVYLVERGAIRIRHNSRDGELITSAIIGQSDLFGAEAAMGDAIRTTSATCIERTRLWAICVRDVHELLSRNPVIAVNLALRFKEQRDDALAALEDIARARVSDRLLALFERLAATHGVPHAGETLINVRLTQADVASLIGTTRETVSVEMKSLIYAGTIRLAGRKIVLSRNTKRDRKRGPGSTATTSEDRIAAALPSL